MINKIIKTMNDFENQVQKKNKQDVFIKELKQKLEAKKIASERWNFAQDVNGNSFIGISVPNTSNKYEIIASIKENLENKRKKEVTYLIANAPYLLDALIDLVTLFDNPNKDDLEAINVLEKARYAIEKSLLKH